MAALSPEATESNAPTGEFGKLHRSAETNRCETAELRRDTTATTVKLNGERNNKSVT